MQSFAELYNATMLNMTPSVKQSLADDIGVPIAAIDRLGAGYYPKEACWLFAERDEAGKIIGLLRRFQNGKKFMVSASTRGLYYPVEAADKSSDRVNLLKDFIRVADAGTTCPICGKKDWCLVSRDDPLTANRVICPRPIAETGAVSRIGDAGWLHVRGGSARPVTGRVIAATDEPILVVEGVTDTLTGLGLGFTTVGRPSADGGQQLLAKLLGGHDKVVIIGENDAGAGEKGMETTFMSLLYLCKDVRRVMPPIGCKDLRDWVAKESLTHDTLLAYITDNASAKRAENVLDDSSPLGVAGEFLALQKKTLRHHRGTWWQYDAGRYAELEMEFLDQQLYGWLRDKRYMTDRGELKPYCPEEQKLRKIKHALISLTQVPNGKNAVEPFIIDGNRAAFPFDRMTCVVFSNGVLDIKTDKLSNLSDNFFCTTTLPYAYDPQAACPVWEKAVDEWFDGDAPRKRLLAQWFGYNLVASNHLQTMMMLYGAPGTGKSTVTNTLTEVLGVDRCVPLEFMDLSYTFGLETLVGKHAAILSEDSVSRRMDGSAVLSMIKRMTGDNFINIHQKFKSTFSTKLYARLTYETNELPQFVDNAQALQRRVRILKFSNSFVNNPDSFLSMKLQKERPGIANWAIAGLKDLIDSGQFVQPASSTAAKKELQLMTSPIAAMIDECLDMSDPSATEPFGSLYELHRSWFTSNGYNPFSRARFTRVITNATGCRFEKQKYGMPYAIGVKVYPAVKLAYS